MGGGGGLWEKEMLCEVVAHVGSTVFRNSQQSSIVPSKNENILFYFPHNILSVNQ